MRADHRGMAAGVPSSTGRKQGCSPEIPAATDRCAAVSTRRLGIAGCPNWGPGSKRTENLCKAVSRNLSQSLALVRHIFATEKCPAHLGRGDGRGT